MGRLAGKRALVTGAGSGIGKATCLRFAAEGATVLAADIRGEEETAACARGIIPWHCDVTDADAVSAMMAGARDRMGGLDIIFNNAGIGRGGKRIHEIDLKDWDDVIDVNLRGAFLVLRFGLPLLMEAGGGSVINTASTSAFKAVVGNGAYTPSKAAVHLLTNMAAIEYAGDGIRVNAVAPGPILTPIYDSVPQDMKAKILSALPLGRMGRPEEVANVVLFLASDEAAFVTGATYLVDGGRLL
jgi:meso-butanediol dehydrogenase/(S,S)-butanediol dehydrogenase/diacetyl reductase